MESLRSSVSSMCIYYSRLVINIAFYIQLSTITVVRKFANFYLFFNFLHFYLCFFFLALAEDIFQIFFPHFGKKYMQSLSKKEEEYLHVI